MRIFRRGADDRSETTGGGGSSGGGSRCDELATYGVDSNADPAPRAGDYAACEECTALGEHHWAHLRICLTCGHVGCCDSSPRRHATAHFDESGHPVMRSAEPGEVWRWCYVHEVTG
ncbi:UBP-type zinc finger domain-containing protein [Gordonia sp. SL306]|uniref:UBP-type zinc finger domain-containing protein n=1 Tax=Gordonia sp. SL306 TaxID=2995145 RepID=UPI00226F2608|nr:UBP-type zinc finger domain-containing protein [Gordonia sp. SL306]WAC56967.1 UBP-type zinc finger domain-containing protein [Gordonia sp. SL306]